MISELEIIQTKDHDYAFVMNREKLEHLVEAVENYIERWSNKMPNYHMTEMMEINDELRDALRQ